MCRKVLYRIKGCPLIDGCPFICKINFLKKDFLFAYRFFVPSAEKNSYLGREKFFSAQEKIKVG